MFFVFLSVLVVHSIQVQQPDSRIMTTLLTPWCTAWNLRLFVVPQVDGMEILNTKDPWIKGSLRCVFFGARKKKVGKNERSY